MAVAKITPPEQPLIEELISQYPKYSKNQPCGWFVYSNDMAKVKSHPIYACHALMYSDPIGCDNLITSAPVKTELALHYYDYLARGPYRAYQDKISVEQLNDEYFIRCTELDKWPSNVLYNFCIATRVPFEHEPYLNNWKSMMNAGIDENLAFALSPFRFAGVEKPVKLPTGYSQHFWFDPAASIKNLVNGTPELDLISKKSFKEWPAAVRPTNVIWGLSTSEERATVAGKTPIELCDMFGVPLNPPKPKRVRKPKPKLDNMDHAIQAFDLAAAEVAAHLHMQQPAAGVVNFDIEVNNGWGNNIVQGAD